MRSQKRSRSCWMRGCSSTEPPPSRIPSRKFISTSSTRYTLHCGDRPSTCHTVETDPQHVTLWRQNLNILHCGDRPSTYYTVETRDNNTHKINDDMNPIWFRLGYLQLTTMWTTLENQCPNHIVPKKGQNLHQFHLQAFSGEKKNEEKIRRKKKLICGGALRRCLLKQSTHCFLCKHNK